MISDKKTPLEHYQVKVLKNKEIQERHDAPNPLQNKEILARKDATCERIYGSVAVMHNSELFHKKTMSGFARKDFTLPSGKIIPYQGYEDVALRELLGMYAEKIVNDVKRMPCFMYFWEGKTRRYYPDLYVPSENKFIEVKSTYTYMQFRAKNQAKRVCVLEKGFQFEFWICDKTTILYRTDGRRMRRFRGLFLGRKSRKRKRKSRKRKSRRRKSRKSRKRKSRKRRRKSRRSRKRKRKR